MQFPSSALATRGGARLHLAKTVSYAIGEPQSSANFSPATIVRTSTVSAAASSAL